MPRRPREVAESGYYHVVLRGSGKQVIFEDDAGRRVFLDALSRKTTASGIRVIAWCLMDNHVHLVLEDPGGALSEVMRDVASDYAQRFNRWTGHVGHVFESRFKSSAIESETYLLQAVRYVHDNPQKAGVCAAPDYPWSSYREYVGVPWIADTSLVLGMLGGVDGFVAFSSEGAVRPVYRFDRRRRIPDEEMGALASDALEGAASHEVRALPKGERNRALRRLRDVGLSVRQIERLTGIGHATISRVTVCGE